ncbi:hypothetical protein [Georgenia daeguensis]
MARLHRRPAVVMLLAALGVVAATGTASADPTDPPGHSDFGKHVVEHNEHFDGEHNPGVVHQGYSNWEGHDHG